MNPSAKRVVVSALAAIALPLIADAQSEQAVAAISAAYDQLSAGNYQEAASAYEKVLKDFPSDASAPAAALQLAQAYYFLKDYDKAQATLTQAFSGPPLSPEQREAADALLPQILLAKASSMPPDAPGRKMAHEEAISKFGAYVVKYPNSPGLEANVRSLALANLQIQKYNDAVNALKQNIQRFPKSPTIDASKDLLAVVLATQGSDELAKAKGLKDFSRYTEAAELLREIIREKSDIAMMNDASAQLGEILLSQAAYSSPEERPKLYEEALAALRGVAPAEQVVAWQKEKIAGYRLPQARRDREAGHGAVEPTQPRKRIRAEAAGGNPGATRPGLERAAEDGGDLFPARQVQRGARRARPCAAVPRDGRREKSGNCIS